MSEDQDRFAFDAGYMSPEFALASCGYLSLDPRRLPEMLDRLPAPVSRRERAVVAAIRWRIGHASRRFAV
jgi:hypothetical protein